MAGFAKSFSGLDISWLRGPDLNRRPSGYEPDELPGCSTPRQAHDAKEGLDLETIRLADLATTYSPAP